MIITNQYDMITTQSLSPTSIIWLPHDHYHQLVLYDYDTITTTNQYYMITKPLPPTSILWLPHHHYHQLVLYDYHTITITN